MKLPAPRSLSGPRAVVAAGTAGLLVVGAVGVVLVRGAGDPDDATKVAEASRVLQSVSATVGSDGTITALDGTVVAVDSEGGSSTTTTEYSLEEMADELPVRVRTAYRTDEGTGTDLDDLDGYDGRVEIALTVENLTVEPERLTYDVNGNQRTRTALVGVPLSVVASADLGDIDPATVVTDGTTGTATNGVLSRTEDDQTQVQWATIIAPPQLGTTATLRLVLDAEDFSAPDVDLSVQQGLVTDPSLGALVDAAFNPASSEELALQQRTIALIGEVNTVIARAGDSIGDVRGTLRRSAETIGEKTVSDLQASTRNIASSMSALGQTVDSLGNDLGGALQATGSTAISQLQSSVASIDALLGDTRQTPPTAQVTGAGCETSVALPGRDATLYGSLLSVSSQLDAYAGATQACKGFVQQRLISTIGTADSVDAAECKDANGVALPVEQLSVTCSLYSTAAEFASVAGTFSDKYEPARDGLLGLKNTGVGSAAMTLTDAVTALTGVLTPGDTYESDITTRINEVDAAITGVDTQVKLLGQKVGEQGGASADLADDLVDTRNVLCLGAHPLGDAKASVASQTLVGQDCSTENIAVDDATVESVVGRTAAQATTLAALAASTDPDATSDIRQAITAARTNVSALRTAVAGSGATGGLGDLIADLEDKAGDVSDAADAVATTGLTLQGGIGTEKVPAVEDDLTTPNVDESAPEVPGTGVLGLVEEAFTSAESELTERIDTVTDAQRLRLVEQTAQDATEIGTAFERSVAGLNAAGTKVRADGKATIDEQKGRLGGNAAKSVQALTASVKGGLAQIERSVTGSTRDTEAASRILQADLQNVLLDLGTRDVDGSGLLGSMAASAATAGTANVTLAEATDTTTSFAGVRDSSIAGLYLRQAQADASFARQAEQPAFGLDLPASAQHRTVYTFHVRTGQ